MHMEKEMEKSTFITTGWMLVKPYFVKEQNQFNPPTQIDELPTQDEAPHDSDEEEHVI